MRAFFSMVFRELRMVRKEKTILFAILIQLFIASFSSILLVGLMAFYDPDSIGQNTNINLTVGVIGDNGSPLIDFMEQRHLRVAIFDNADRAESAFKSGRVDAIVYIPEKTADTVDIKLVLPSMDARATVALMILKGPMKQYENYLRQQNGIQVRYSDAGGKPSTTYEFLYTIIIPVLMFFPAFVAGSMVIDTISEEIQNKTLATLLSAPVSLSRILSAKIVAAVIIAVIQCILWAVLLQVNSFSIQNLWLVLLLSIIIAAIVSITALLISILFRDRERSQFIYSIIIVIGIGVSFFFNISPFSLIARLATGDYYVGILQVMLYLLPLIALCIIFPFVAKKVLSNLV
jgi:ABC-2 type transport system permease protein